jgi:hypothetical protein
MRGRETLSLQEISEKILPASEWRRLMQSRFCPGSSQEFRTVTLPDSEITQFTKSIPLLHIAPGADKISDLPPFPRASDEDCCATSLNGVLSSKLDVLEMAVQRFLAPPDCC